MTWLLVDKTTHELIEGPLDHKPEELDGTYATMVLAGYPETYEWVPELQGFRGIVTLSERTQAITTRRDQAEWGGCETPAGRADTTVDSQRKINGLVTMAMVSKMLAQPFTAGFTLASNLTIQLDADQMIALGVAVGRHVGACHAVSLAKKAALIAGEQVDLDSGWPGEPPVVTLQEPANDQDAPGSAEAA